MMIQLALETAQYALAFMAAVALYQMVRAPQIP